MFIALLGPSSSLTGWCIEVVKHLMTLQFKACQQINANTVAELKTAFAGGREEHVLLCAQAPDTEILRLIVDGRVRTAVVLEHPVALGHHYQQGQSMNAQSAIAAVAIGFCALHDLILNDQTILITRNKDDNVSSYVHELASRYGFTIRPDQLDQLSKGLPRPPTSITSNADDRHLVVTALQSFEPLLIRRPIDHMTWPIDVFQKYDSPGGPLNGRVELTGGGRIFAFSPYLHVPPGRWTAGSQFEIGENLSGNKLKIDVFAGGATETVVAECEWPMPAQGEFTTELPFEVTEPRIPLSMRFYCLEGAIEGWFDLKEAVIDRA